MILNSVTKKDMHYQMRCCFKSKWWTANWFENFPILRQNFTGSVSTKRTWLMCLGYVSVWSSLRGNWHISPGSAPGHQGPAAACPGRLLGLPLPSTGAVLVWYPKIQCCGAVIFLFSAPSPPFFLILAPAPFLALKVYSHFKMYILCSNHRWAPLF